MEGCAIGTRRWVVVGALLVFALFSLFAQRSVGLDRTVSPLTLAAQQPLVLLQAVIGCLLGGLLGARLGLSVGRLLTRRPQARDRYAWYSVIVWVWPWVLLVVMNLEGYQASYGELPWLITLLVHLFPLTLGFKQTFPFALAVGYFVGTRGQGSIS